LLGGYVVKDLTVLGRDLRRIVLVDVRAQSFLLQPDNGIPISTWVNDPDDRTLLQQLLPFLRYCAAFPDVRTFIGGLRNKSCD
jgi:CTD small phosphatase-like protein 2